MNARTNLDKAATNRDGSPKFPSTPFYNEHEFGGTVGGPLIKNRTFFFGSIQRWTIRKLGSGTTISGVPTTAGDSLLQSTVGSRPQVAALLKFVPGAAAQATSGGNPTFASYCVGARTLPACSGGQPVNIPTAPLPAPRSSPSSNLH